MRYRRANAAGGTYFFTVNLAERRSDVFVRHIDDSRAAMKSVKDAYPFAILARPTYRAENSRGSVVDAAANAGLSWGGEFNKSYPVHFYMNPAGSRSGAILDAQSTFKI